MQEPLFSAYEGEAPNLLEQDTEVSEAKRDAIARRAEFLAKMEGHSVAYIVEHTLMVARECAIGMMTDPEGKGNDGVMFGSPTQVISKLIQRIEGIVDSLGGMAREMHPLSRPDEHDPDCEFYGPKEDN